MSSVMFIGGIWDDGIIIDDYTKESKYLGEDAFGNPIFDTTYTEIGKLLHDMKYNGHYNTSEKIADICVQSLATWFSNKQIDIVLPTPPTNKRIEQPVFLIAEAIASRLNIPYSDSILQKTDSHQAKNMTYETRKHLQGAIQKLKNAKRKCNILLIDDFYSSGYTATECVSVLKEDPLIEKVYYLAIVKTKR